MGTQRIAGRHRDGRLWCLGLKIQADNRMLLCEGMWFAHVSGFPQETSLCPSSGPELQEDSRLRVRSGHGLFPREPPVVKGMHVNNLLCFDDGGRLRFLFPPPLAFQRHPELVHHRAAERTLGQRGDRHLLVINNVYLDVCKHDSAGGTFSI